MPTQNQAADVAKEVLAYCTSCKMDLAHIVMAMKGDRIVKAQCKTCKKEHAYKAPKGITEPDPKAAKKKEARAKKKAEAKDSTTSIETEWEKLMTTHKANPFRGYKVSEKYKLGDKLKHSNFGEGIVSKLIYPNKIEVIFRTEMKILIAGK